MVKIFLSYREKDKKNRDDLVSMMKNTNNTLYYIPLTDRINLRNEALNERKQKIREHLRPIINECQILALILGETTHSGPVVKYECELALSQKKDIFAIRIPGTTGGLPKILKDKNIKIIDFKISEIQGIVDKLTK